MPLPFNPTRTNKTEQRYRRRTRNLVVQCRKKLSIPDNESLDYRRFVGWLVNRKPELSRDTWRQYKASVMFFLEKESENDNQIAQEAMEYLSTIDVSGCVKKSKKTSSRKMKKFPLRDYKALIKHIDDFPSPWANDLKRWIGSSLLTGLRPGEWATARMDEIDGVAVLVVQNAKATNGRAHGPSRVIFLDGLTSDERDMIKKHVDRANEWEQSQQYSKFYYGCAASLSRASRRVWPRRESHVTLYTMRHQFSANAKASGFTREEIAALMGHATNETATEHYGRKTAGFDMVRVRPSPEEVARIRKVFKNKFNDPSPSSLGVQSPSIE